MKKHLFLLSSVFAVLSLQAQVATMKVAGNTGVKVKTGTTLYVGGEMKVAQYTNANKVSNEGNIRITQKLTNENSTGSNFVNEFPSTGNYGQLIVNGNEANFGNITSVIKLNDNFVYHSLAIPYTNVNALNLVKQIYKDKTDTQIQNSFVGYTGEYQGVKYFDPNRKNNPLFEWNNNNYYLKQLAQGDNIIPSTYYAVNKGSSLGAFNTQNKISIVGEPAKQEYSVSLNSYVIDDNRGINPVGEYYGSYIIDYTKVLPSNWGITSGVAPALNGFGSNIFNLANPYTSNIDLFQLPETLRSQIATLVQYKQQNYADAINEGNASGSVGNTGFDAYNIRNNTGDTELRYVRPFQTFSIKMVDGFKGTNLVFNDALKTFKAESGVITTPNIVYNRERIENTPVVNQVGLDVLENEVRIAKTYVVASSIYEAAQTGEGIETYDPTMTSNDTGIYTLQENEDGTVNKELANGRTYINGVNETKYIGKPIHLVFQNGKGQYTFKARLNEDLLNNKNTFYFEDKITGDVIKINKDFSYTANVNGTEKDRFVLYWAALPTEEITKEIAEESIDNTVVFKDQDSYKIRFDKEMGIADIFVYSISGQLINVDKKVNTSNDYIVPVVGNTSVYIIKIVGDNGKVVTKKIIK